MIEEPPKSRLPMLRQARDAQDDDNPREQKMADIDRDMVARVAETVTRVAVLETRVNAHEKGCIERQGAIMDKFDEQSAARDVLKHEISASNTVTLEAVKEVHARISKTNDRMYSLVATALISIIALLVAALANYLLRYGVTPP